ncbi:MAG: Tol-Pal system beta propeller repeat protein TolB [Methylococcales bacterium]|nr:Tol-Pal system beta propeller repeat protein TolB [Methylococcales bacterium]
MRRFLSRSLMWKPTLLLLFLALSCPSRAELTIQITGQRAQATPIAIVPFKNAEGLKLDPATVVRADLANSGYFNSLSVSHMLTQPHQAEDIDFRHWRVLNQDYLVIGQITPDSTGHEVRFQLFNVHDGVKLAGYRLHAPNHQLRQAGHQISDLIFEHLTGQQGFFQSRIAYLSLETNAKGGKRYLINIADVDGGNARSVVASPQPLMSPAWSPKGNKLAYVSFERGKASIYVQELTTGKRERVSDAPGLNGAPAWSPDGQKLAMTLSKDGNPEVYVLNLANRQLQRLTENLAIDTEPAWSPDGQYLVFTSNRGGSPQLYKVAARGGRAQRLTFEGDYNAGASFSPDGRYLAMVHGNRGDYRIAALDLGNQTLTVLSAGNQDESPSFAPNSHAILYATQKQGNRHLAMVTVDGRSHPKQLNAVKGWVREPAWSP